MTPITVEVFDQGRSVYRASLDGQAEFGRQNQGEDPPYNQKRKGNIWRVIIARLDETTISRQHVEVEPLADGQLRVTNRSRNPVKVEPDQVLPPAAACDV